MDKRGKLIALYSSAPQSGKSTFAKFVKELLGDKVVRMSFASPLKNTAIAFLVSVGIDKERATRYIMVDKHEIIPELGVTGRHILQTLGAEWGRDCISDHVWVNALLRRADALLAQGTHVIVDDMRFLNELETLRLQDAITIRIKNERTYGVDQSDAVTHQSEGALDDEFFEMEYDNIYSLSLYKAHVKKLLVKQGMLKNDII